MFFQVSRQRRERRRQQVRIDQGAGIGHPPERDQQRRPHDELDDAAKALAVDARCPGERRVGRGCSERHPDASIGSNAQRVATQALATPMPVPPRRPRQRLKRSISQAIFLFFGAPGERRSGRSGRRGCANAQQECNSPRRLRSSEINDDKSACYVCINCMQSIVQRDLMKLYMRGLEPRIHRLLGHDSAQPNLTREAIGPAGQAGFLHRSFQADGCALEPRRGRRIA